MYILRVKISNIKLVIKNLPVNLKIDENNNVHENLRKKRKKHTYKSI